MGISLLSALAKQQGHKVDLAFSVSLFDDRSHLTCGPLARFFDDTNQVLAAIERQQPDVLCFSPVSGTYRWMLSVAQKAKSLVSRVKNVFGGIHTSAVPDAVLAQGPVDYVCVGEGDVAFVEILKHIERGEEGRPIPNTRYKLPDGTVVRGPQIGFFQDLDALPAFDKTIWEEHMRLNDTYLTMASRGCPFRCSFCFNCFFADLPQEPGPYIRYRGVEHMMSELIAAKRRYRFRMVEFFDDVFTLNKKWLKEFLERYKDEIGVPFQCFTHVQYIDQDRARWMSEAGCRSAQIGFQTADEQYKFEVLNRRERLGQFEQALAVLKKYRILAKFDHMFGLPGEPLEAMTKAREFYSTNTPYRIQTYWFNPYPGTRILGHARKLGLLTQADIERMTRGEVFDTFTRSNEFIDKDKIKIYKIHELIFKILPSLPRGLSGTLRPEHLSWLPSKICSFLVFVSDVVIGFCRWDIDHRFYAKFYLHHIWRFLCRKCKARPGPVTRVC